MTLTDNNSEEDADYGMTWQERMKYLYSYSTYRNIFQYSTVSGAYEGLINRVNVCQENMNDCECSFEIDEEDCSALALPFTTPSRSHRAPFRFAHSSSAIYSGPARP